MFNLYAHAESIFLNQEEKKSKGKKKEKRKKEAENPYAEKQLHSFVL